MLAAAVVMKLRDVSADARRDGGVERWMNSTTERRLVEAETSEQLRDQRRVLLFAGVARSHDRDRLVADPVEGPSREHGRCLKRLRRGAQEHEIHRGGACPTVGEGEFDVVTALDSLAAKDVDARL